MAKEYFEKLSNLLKEVNMENEVPLSMEIKHFLMVQLCM
jgi:hypothetical protein